MSLNFNLQKEGLEKSYANCEYKNVHFIRLFWSRRPNCHDEVCNFEAKNNCLDGKDVLNNAQENKRQ